LLAALFPAADFFNAIFLRISKAGERFLGVGAGRLTTGLESAGASSSGALRSKSQ
jgi:hypothetical protein